MPKDFLTDEQVELEIERLSESPAVMLAKQEHQVSPQAVYVSASILREARQRAYGAGHHAQQSGRNGKGP